MILNNLFPNYYYKSAYTIDYQQFFNDGYKAIIYDIDNTLVEHDAPKNDKVIKLTNDLKKIGYYIFILSNNCEQRVSSFSKNIPIDDYCYNSNKPLNNKFLYLSNKYNVPVSKFLVIGDQLFTDILGGNNSKMTTILVDPIGKEILLKIKFKRILEFIFKNIFKNKFNSIKR